MTKLLRARTDLIVTNLDQELVLMNPVTQTMFTLNEVGHTIWRTLAHAPGQAVDQDTLVRAVTDAYEVPEDTARQDVLRLSHELAAQGLATWVED